MSVKDARGSHQILTGQGCGSAAERETRNSWRGMGLDVTGRVARVDEFLARRVSQSLEAWPKQNPSWHDKAIGCVACDIAKILEDPSIEGVLLPCGLQDALKVGAE